MKTVACSAVNLLLLLLATRPITAGPVDYVILSNQTFGCDSQNYDALTGLSSFHCPSDAVSFSSSGGALGQTSAFVGISGAAGAASASAFATANLANGTIGAEAAGNNTTGGQGQASAQMFDSLTFTNTTGSAAHIDVFVTLHGSIVTGPSSFNADNQGWQDVDWAFCLGSPCYLSSGNTFRYLFLHNSGLGPNGITITEPSSGWFSTSLAPGSDPTSEVWHGVFSVPAGQSPADLFAYLATDCREGASCDYSHTAAISMNLPTGVSFTSNSGVFLTQKSAVPEPATLALVGVALLALAARRYRVHSARRAAASRVRG